MDVSLEPRFGSKFWAQLLKLPHYTSLGWSDIWKNAAASSAVIHSDRGAVARQSSHYDLAIAQIPGVCYLRKASSWCSQQLGLKINSSRSSIVSSKCSNSRFSSGVHSSHSFVGFLLSGFSYMWHIPGWTTKQLDVPWGSRCRSWFSFQVWGRRWVPWRQSSASSSRCFRITVEITSGSTRGGWYLDPPWAVWTPWFQKACRVLFFLRGEGHATFGHLEEAFSHI